MANYGSSTDLATLITAISDSVSTDLKQLSLDMADAWVETNVDPITGTVPKLVVKAATYKAYAYILRNLYDTDIADTPIAQFWDKEAQALIDAYSDSLPDTSTNPSPYSHSLTPTRKEMNKDVRSVYDNTDYTNQDDTRWDSER